MHLRTSKNLGMVRVQPQSCVRVIHVHEVKWKTNHHVASSCL